MGDRAHLNKNHFEKGKKKAASMLNKLLIGLRVFKKAIEWIENHRRVGELTSADMSLSHSLFIIKRNVGDHQKVKYF